MSMSHSDGEICLQFNGMVEAGGRMGSASNLTECNCQENECGQNKEEN